MKQLQRNKHRFYYAKYLSDAEVTSTMTIGGEEYETYGGETHVSYTDPVECYGNISVPTGFANVERFGSIVSYDINITLEDPNTPINEQTILWVDKEPYDSAGNVTDYNYLVRRVARSLNSATLQCAMAEVTH